MRTKTCRIPTYYFGVAQSGNLHQPQDRAASNESTGPILQGKNEKIQILQR